MPITEEDLLAARNAWSDGLIKIGKTYEAEGIEKAREVADEVLSAAYGYGLGPVMFKPTMSGGKQTFRPTQKGALSYFVAHDPDYPNDTGFAIRGWQSVEMQSAGSFIDGDVAMWMGHAIFTGKDGEIVESDKTFGYRKDADGVLHIVLHHSSIPYEV